METSVFGIYLTLLFILAGAVLLFLNRKDSAKLYSVIRYEIPIVLLFPLALYCLGIKPFSAISYIICVLFGFSPWVYILLFVLLGVCASASALIKSDKGLIFGFCGAALLLTYVLIFFRTEFSLLFVLLPYELYLLLLCVLGLHLCKNRDKTFADNADDVNTNTPAASAKLTPAVAVTADTPKAENNNISSNTMEQKLKPGSAFRRGIIGASVGAVIMLIFILFIGSLDSGEELELYHLLLYPFCGMLYGFGFAFADWRKLLKSVKRGAAEGAAGLGIGLILAKLTDNKNWGMWGWMFFVFRLTFSIAFGWIPGIWYGIKAIHQELSEASVPAPEQPVLTNSKKSPAAQTSCSPVLNCLSGTFAGAEFPLTSGEVITIGSDPAHCQIVLEGENILPEHCRIWFAGNGGGWLAEDLSGGNTLRDGIRPLACGTVTALPQGTVLSFGSGQSTHRFKLK